MARTQNAVVISIISALLLVGTAAPADEASKKPARMSPQDFADRLALAIEVVHKGYFIEIDKARLLRWAVTGLYNRRGRSIPEEVTERLDNIRKPEGKEVRSVLLEVGKDFEGELERCTDLALERMLGPLDGGCAVIDRDHICILRSYTTGIGVRLGTDPFTKMIRVIYPFRDGPAYKAGLRSRDVIAEIVRTDDIEKPSDNPRVVSTRGLKLSHAYGELLGAQGSKVLLKVRRLGTDGLIEFKVTHAEVEEESVLGVRRTADDRWDYWLDHGRRIAYVRLVRFNKDSASNLLTALGALRKQGLKGLVLDMRCNSGGLLDCGVAVAELFVGQAPICTLRLRNQEDFSQAGQRKESFRDFPMVCLVNNETERMAEVVAARLQDHKQAVIVGERTPGKAANRFVCPLLEGRMLITNGAFYRPNGKKLTRISPPGQPDDDWGVRPDKGFEVKLSARDLDALRAHLDDLLSIPPPGKAGKLKVAAFRDRELAIAVNELRRERKPAPEKENGREHRGSRLPFGHGIMSGESGTPRHCSVARDEEHGRRVAECR